MVVYYYLVIDDDVVAAVVVVGPKVVVGDVGVAVVVETVQLENRVEVEIGLTTETINGQVKVVEKGSLELDLV